MAGIRYVDVWLRAGPRREWVHGWFLPNDRHAPVVLLLHGTGRTIAGMVHVAAAIHRAGAAVLMIDYRGLGRSSRRALTETTMYEDAEAAWQELRWHQPDPALRLVYGHSLGGAIALELAARYPDVNGVVVESAPTSIAALLRESWVARIYPVDAILAGRFDAAAKIRRLGAPLLVIHGKRDPIVAPSMGVELYLRATGREAAAARRRRRAQRRRDRRRGRVRDGGRAHAAAPARTGARPALKPIRPAPIRDASGARRYCPPGRRSSESRATMVATPAPAATALPDAPRFPFGRECPFHPPSLYARARARRTALRGDALERPARLAGDPARGDPRGAHGRRPLQRRDGAPGLPDRHRGARHRRPERARVRRHGQPGARSLPAHVHPRVQRAADARAPAADRGDRGDRDRRARRARAARRPRGHARGEVPVARHVRADRLAVRGSPLHHRLRGRAARADPDAGRGAREGARPRRLLPPADRRQGSGARATTW